MRREALDLLEKRGVPAGMVLKVETPLDAMLPHLPRLRFVTLLGTAIGVKGEGLDPRATGRLTATAQDHCRCRPAEARRAGLGWRQPRADRAAAAAGGR